MTAPVQKLEADLSPERSGRITGSRMAAILRYGKYATRAQVLRDMVRQHLGLPDLFTGNEATEYGALHEPDALRQYEAERGVTLHGGQEIVIHPFYDFLAVTPDGLVDDDGLVEAKCPFRARYKHIDERLDYWAQIQLQLECTGRSWCDFIVWRPRRPLAISRVEYDPNWLPSIMPQLIDFMADFQQAINDPVVIARERGRGQVVELGSHKQFLADKKRWREIAAQTAELTAELEQVKKRVDDVMGDAEAAVVDGVPVARRRYRSGSSVFDRASFKKEFAQLEAQYSKNTPGSTYVVLEDETEGNDNA